MKSDKKNIVILLLILLLGIAFTILLFKQKINNDYETEILKAKKLNDSVINNLLKKNEELILLYKQIQKDNKQQNESQQIDGISIGNRPISLEELIDLTNQYQVKYYELKRKSIVDSLNIERLNKVIKILEKDKILTRDENGNFSYRQTGQFDSLYNQQLKEIKKLENEVQAKNSLLKLIKDNYGIDTQIEYETTYNTVTLINTQKIDSALWIFPYYKHKIKTNKKGETIIK